MLFHLLQILSNVILNQKRELEKTWFKNLLSNNFVLIQILFIDNMHYLLYCHMIKEKFS